MSEIVAWLTKVEQAFRPKPIIYLSPAFVSECMGGNAGPLVNTPSTSPTGV